MDGGTVEASRTAWKRTTVLVVKLKGWVIIISFFDKERNGLLSCMIQTAHPVMRQLWYIEVVVMYWTCKWDGKTRNFYNFDGEICWKGNYLDD